jgi:hypothetical protein
VTGAKELRRALKKMDGRLKDLKDVHDDVGHVVASRARAIAPHLSGTLAGSIGNDRRVAGASVFAGSRRVPYAGPIHFGWPAHNIEAQPFLYEALEDSQDDITRIYTLGMEVLIDKLERETPP